MDLLLKENNRVQYTVIRLSLLTLVFTMISCGQNSAAPSQQNASPSANSSDAGDVDNEIIPPSYSTSIRKSHVTRNLRACAYWQVLADRTKADASDASPTFQIVHGLEVKRAWSERAFSPALGREGFKPQVTGYFRASTLPQILYFLSGEHVVYENREKYPQEASQFGFVKKIPTRLESIALENVDRALNEYHSQGLLTDTQYRHLKSKAAAWARADLRDSEFRKLRNQGIKTLVAQQIPGIFTESSEPSTRIEKSKILENLYKVLGRNEFTWKDKDSIELLGLATPLFISSSWVERKEDLQRTYAALSHSDNSDREIFCKFAIASRLTAQIITMKGIKAAPAMLADGTLPNFSDYNDFFEGTYPQTDIPSIFESEGVEKRSLVATQDWLEAQMAHKGKADYMLAGRSDLSEFLDVVDYFVTLNSYRSPELWGPYLEPKLLLASAAMLGVQAKILSTRHIELRPNVRLSLTPSIDDSPENLAKLLRLSLHRIEAFQSLANNPTNFELKIFTPAQRRALTEGLNLQLTTLVVEARNRIREGSINEPVLMAHDEVADAIGNQFLRKLTQDYRNKLNFTVSN